MANYSRRKKRSGLLRGVFESMSKERAIEQVTKSLDEALKRAEDNQGRELHEEIVHIINNIKKKKDVVTND